MEGSLKSMDDCLLSFSSSRGRRRPPLMCAVFCRTRILTPNSREQRATNSGESIALRVIGIVVCH